MKLGKLKEIDIRKVWAHPLVFHTAPPGCGTIPYRMLGVLLLGARRDRKLRFLYNYTIDFILRRLL